MKRLDSQSIASKRYEIHERYGNQTERFYDDKLIEDMIGVEGEIAFGEKYDVMGYWTGDSEAPYGDNGIDFDIPELGTIDVKTARKPVNLLEKSGKVRADFYVLGKYYHAEQIDFIGWHYGVELVKVAPMDVGGKGIISHYIHSSKLFPMNALEVKISIAKFIISISGDNSTG